MKRVFISYSLVDKDRFVVSKLTTEFQKKGMIVTTSQNFFAEQLDFTTIKNIDISDLFVGVITDESGTADRVINEWGYANTKTIPNMLIIEDTVQVSNVNSNNIIRFNRFNVDEAILKVNKKIESSKSSSSNDEWVKWAWGGAAIIALLSLLTTDERRPTKRYKRYKK